MGTFWNFQSLLKEFNILIKTDFFNKAPRFSVEKKNIFPNYFINFNFNSCRQVFRENNKYAERVFKMKKNIPFHWIMNSILLSINRSLKTYVWIVISCALNSDNENQSIDLNWINDWQDPGWLDVIAWMLPLVIRSHPHFVSLQISKIQNQ